jgi:hypothetical protein
VVGSDAAEFPNPMKPVVEVINAAAAPLHIV